MLRVAGWLRVDKGGLGGGSGGSRGERLGHPGRTA